MIAALAMVFWISTVWLALALERASARADTAERESQSWRKRAEDAEAVIERARLRDQEAMTAAQLKALVERRRDYYYESCKEAAFRDAMADRARDDSEKANMPYEGRLQ